MTHAERLAHARALVDDLSARAAAAMKDLGGDGSPGAYFVGYASVALQELDAVLRAEEAEEPRAKTIPPRPRLAVAAGGSR